MDWASSHAISTCSRIRRDNVARFSRSGMSKMLCKGAMGFHQPGFRISAVIAFLFLGSSCKKVASPPIQPAAQAEAQSREVSKESELFFTYVEPNGVFATTDKAEKVPEIARRLVRIMGRGKGSVQRRNGADVEVVDLHKLLANGKIWPQVMSREAFESGAMAQLPPGDSCPLAGSHGPHLVEEPEIAGAQDGPPIVILYRTSWCKACKAARQYLVSNRIPFTSKDIEKDPSAARELEQKASRFGMSAERVPILDVRGRLLVGYDETRLDGYLGDW
jgi:glutaredoxin